MMTEFSCIIFLNIWTMVSNFKIIPYFNILQNFVQNVRKPKSPSILTCEVKVLLSTFHYVPLCSTMFHYVPLCSTMFCYVPLCSTMFHYVSDYLHWGQQHARVFLLHPDAAWEVTQRIPLETESVKNHG